MRLLLFPLFLFVCVACSVAGQRGSEETVAAFEVPLPKVEDRAAFLAILRDAAKAEGGHVDAATDAELRDTGVAIPLAKMSVHAAAWQGSDDNHSWAVIMDQADHLGQVWIMFSRDDDEKSSTGFRVRAMQNIRARWPGTLSLPILDRRTIPLRSDLIRTLQGYRLKASAASKYESKPKN